jgi:CheY-like chemotaxis protein
LNSEPKGSDRLDDRDRYPTAGPGRRERRRPEGASEREGLEKCSILLVDDRPENLLALKAVLAPLNQNLVTAESGEEALKHLLDHEFALILLDVQMPGMDGFETALQIKERPKTKDIPIIFITAISQEPHHALRGYSAGAVDYLFKPFDPWALRTKVGVFTELHNKTRKLQRQTEIGKRIEDTAARLRAVLDGGTNADEASALAAELEELSKQLPR